MLALLAVALVASRAAPWPTAQEPVPAREAAAPAPRQFPRLTPTDKARVDLNLYTLRAGKTEAARAAARAVLVSCGAGAVPPSLAAFDRFPGERVGELRAVLDRILAEGDLDLALAECGPKAPPAARAYVARRVADSQREDAAVLLRPLLSDRDAAAAYEAGRGLLARGDPAGLPPVLGAVRLLWKQDEARLRGDFASFPRGPVSAAAAELVRASAAEDRLAAVRLFGLVGAPQHARVLKAVLDDPDQQLKLNAINACRAVVDGAPPLERPSVHQIIEEAEAWKGRL